MDNERKEQNTEELPREENAGERDQEPEAEARIAALTAERDQLAAENAELNERLLRRQADFENFRKRVERDRSDFIQFAAMDLMRDLLPILDDFERALQVETADKDYARGVEMIYSRLLDTLRKMGLEPIDTAGKIFDPNIHQALDKVHTDEAEEHAILQEYQRGYNFKGRLLRPSMVKVAVRP